jgi:hypothetical protein
MLLREMKHLQQQQQQGGSADSLVNVLWHSKLLHLLQHAAAACKQDKEDCSYLPSCNQVCHCC